MEFDGPNYGCLRVEVIVEMIVDGANNRFSSWFMVAKGKVNDEKKPCCVRHFPCVKALVSRAFDTLKPMGDVVVQLQSAGLRQGYQ